MKEIKSRTALALALLLCSFFSSGAQTIVKGVIKDAGTQQLLQ